MTLESIVPLLLSMTAGRHFTHMVCADGRPLRWDQFKVYRRGHGRCEIGLFHMEGAPCHAIGVTDVTEDKIVLATAEGNSVVLDVVPRFMAIKLQDVAAALNAPHQQELAAELLGQPSIETALGLLRTFSVGHHPDIVARINNRQVARRHFERFDACGHTQIAFDTPPRMKLSKGCRATDVLKATTARISLTTSTGESAMLDFAPAKPAVSWTEVARVMPKSKRETFLAGLPVAA